MKTSPTIFKLLKKGILPNTAICSVVAAIMLAAACEPNQRIIKSSKERTAEPLPSVSATPENSFEQDLASMRDARFLFIYVYRRKDGAPLDSEDRHFAANTIPQEMNRRMVTDQDRAIIVGSNFKMPKQAQEALAARFDFVDMSQEKRQEPRWIL